jgi:hypothetical protein
LGVLLPQLWLSLNRPDSLLHNWLLNWRPMNAFARQFAHVDGDYAYTLPVALYYLQPLSHPNYMVPVLGLAALWGAWSLWRRRIWQPLILLGGWFGVVYLFLAGIPYENFRFGLTLFLPVVLLAGVGVEMLYMESPLPEVYGLRSRVDFKIWQRGVYIVVIVCLLGMGLWTVYSTHRFLSAQNHSKAIVQEIENVLPEHATVMAFGLTLTLEHYTELEIVEFYNLDEERLETVTAANNPIYLLLDLSNVAYQWQNRPPQLNYRWLQEHRKLLPVADLPPYTLFQITGKNHE